MRELDSADSLRLCEKLVSWGPTCRGRLAAEPWRPLRDAIATAKRGPPFSLVALRPDARWLAARGSGPEAGAAVPRRAGGGSRPRRLLSTTDCSVPRTSGRRGESGRRTGGNGAGFVTAEHRGERAGHTVSCKLCFSTKMTPLAALAGSPRLVLAGSLPVQTVSLCLFASKTSQTRSQ